MDIDVKLSFTDQEMSDYLKEKGFSTLSYELGKRVFTMYVNGSVNQYLKNIVLNEKAFERDKKLEKILE